MYHRLLLSGRCLASSSPCTTPCVGESCLVSVWQCSPLSDQVQQQTAAFSQVRLTGDLEWLTQRHGRPHLGSCGWTRPLGTIIQSTITHVSAGISCQHSQQVSRERGSPQFRGESPSSLHLRTGTSFFRVTSSGSAHPLPLIDAGHGWHSLEL